MANPTISLCMITKNEEKHIEQCLNSVKVIVDEIIIVDTGSTDKTKEIAKKFCDMRVSSRTRSQLTAKIFDFKWIDDFSAARNESLKHATKDWILVLDADETIAAQDLPKLKELVFDEDCIGYYFIRRNYTNDSNAAGWISSKDDAYTESRCASGWFCSKLIRLFRNNKGIKYEGVVHEEILIAIHELGNVKEAPFPIHHFDRVSSEKRELKNELYQKLGEQKLGQKNDFESYCQLGIQAQETGDYPKAIELFKKSLELNKDYYKSWLNLGGCYLMLNNLEEAEQALLNAIYLDSSDYSAHNNLAITYSKLKKMSKAIAEFQKAARLNPQNASIFFNLGMAYDSIGAKNLAYNAFKKAIGLNPNYKERINIDS